MENIIRALIAAARFIEGLAHRAKEHAIQKLSEKQISAERKKDASLAARGQAWDSENLRHADVLQRINRAACEDEECCDATVSELEERIKRLELV